MFFFAYIFLTEKVLRIGLFIIFKYSYKKGEIEFKIHEEVGVSALITLSNLFNHPFNDFYHLSMLMMTYDGR